MVDFFEASFLLLLKSFRSLRKLVEKFQEFDNLVS
jgi:hypothetical protein